MADVNDDPRGWLKLVGAAAVLLLVVPLVVFMVPQVAGADHSYVVLSSSMEPNISAGDVVIVTEVEPSTIEEGDVITFESQAGAETGESDVDRVTHRVVDVVERDGSLHFRTKGDANEDPDRQLVPADAVVGRVAFTIPLIGRFVSFAGTPLGIGLFVILPAVLLGVNELWTMFVAVRGETEETD